MDTDMFGFRLLVIYTVVCNPAFSLDERLNKESFHERHVTEREARPLFVRISQNQPIPMNSLYKNHEKAEQDPLHSLLGGLLSTLLSVSLKSHSLENSENGRGCDANCEHDRRSFSASYQDGKSSSNEDSSHSGENYSNQERSSSEEISSDEDKSSNGESSNDEDKSSDDNNFSNGESSSDEDSSSDDNNSSNGENLSDEDSSSSEESFSDEDSSSSEESSSNEDNSSNGESSSEEDRSSDDDNSSNGESSSDEGRSSSEGSSSDEDSSSSEGSSSDEDSSSSEGSSSDGDSSSDEDSSSSEVSSSDEDSSSSEVSSSDKDSSSSEVSSSDEDSSSSEESSTDEASSSSEESSTDEASSSIEESSSDEGSSSSSLNDETTEYERYLAANNDDNVLSRDDEGNTFNEEMTKNKEYLEKTDYNVLSRNNEDNINKNSYYKRSLMDADVLSRNGGQIAENQQSLIDARVNVLHNEQPLSTDNLEEVVRHLMTNVEELTRDMENKGSKIKKMDYKLEKSRDNPIAFKRVLPLIQQPHQRYSITKAHVDRVIQSDIPYYFYSKENIIQQRAIPTRTLRQIVEPVPTGVEIPQSIASSSLYGSYASAQMYPYDYGDMGIVGTTPGLPEVPVSPI